MGRQPRIPVELTSGPFTLEQARLAGLSRRQLAGTSWRRVERGIYRWAKVADGPLLRLTAVNRRMPGAVFSGRTAGWLYGLDLPPVEPVEVTVAGAGVSARAGVRIHRRKLQAGEVVRHRGLPVTSRLRTAIDLGSRQPLVDAVVALDMALHQRMVSLSELSSYHEAHRGAMGIATLRRALELAEPLTQSPMETRLRLLLVLAGLPRPQAQVALHDQSGRFLGRPDFYYAAHKLALEYDGGTHKGNLVDDNRRQNRLLNGGIKLLRFSAGDIYQTPESVIALVCSAMSQPRR